MPDVRAPRDPAPAAGPTDGLGPVPPGNQPGHQPPWPQDKPLLPPVDDSVEDGGAGRHPFLFEPLLLPAAAAFGITPWTTWVDVGTDDLEVRFGPWSLRTPLDNVAGATVTGPYRFFKVAGPPHLSFSDRGVTFATNRQQGACIQLHEPVPAIAPRGMLRHPAVTVTVADPVALANHLARVADA
ncbi:MAG: hypothetical protein ACSLFP_15925 [Acidimicrobiales bacterium]